MKLEAILNGTARMDDGLADIRLRDEADQEHQLDLPFGELFRRFGMPNPIALDLVITASLCYLVDKTVPRQSAPDNWTRSLDVTLPVSEPKRWFPVADELSQALTFLTGDIWQLHFHQSSHALFEPPAQKPLPVIAPANAVSLFSGGLDSLAGAIDLIAGTHHQRVFLIGHYDSPGPRKVQAYLGSRLRQQYPGRVEILHVRVAHRPVKAAEETLRSRSFVFLALGLYAAQALGTDIPLHMFENGLIALNIPLTPSRNGSCSTRTMHPYYLEQMRSITSMLGIPNTIVNPYALKTKGECVTECAGKDLLVNLADLSVSCSHASRKQNWVRKGSDNCGYCVPCIFRRAAMHRAGLDHGHQYGIDVLAGELAVTDGWESADDLRAVSDFIRHPLTPALLKKKLIAIARFSDLNNHVDLAVRGFAEVKAWLQSGGGRPSAIGGPGHA
jgi:7-cyano-7-deazaguanine synthase in queuosine biosynthesis